MNHLRQSSIKNWLNNRTPLPTVSQLKSQVFSSQFLFKVTFIAIIYSVITTVINEFAIFVNIFSQNFTLLLKIKISLLMFIQSFTMFGALHAVLFIGIALGVGINTVLVIKKLQYIKGQKNIQWTFGAGIFSVASSSCPGCGFSLLSLTGLTSAIPGIPFQGNLFSFIILVLLFVTCAYNISSLNKISCAIKK